MTQKKLYNLKIDENFKKIIPPLSSEELKYLEQNIISDGCREPICVWQNMIIDGHNRYNICTKHKIPFHIQEVEFNSIEEAEAWICSNQLGRRNITDETRRYLIGKRYLKEKVVNHNPNGNNQFKNNIDKNIEKESTTALTAKKLAKEYKIASRTVIDYANYAKSIDVLEENEPEIISKVLNGDIKISHENICKLSREKTHIKDKLKKHLEGRLSFKEQENTPKITVKDMPKYDPDAEVSSLTFTIPSWIGSINRLIASDLNKTSLKARENIIKELNEMKYSIDTLILAIGECND